uniref:Retrotransposon gag domain-containing protein n=1 Tax=Chromera velia CCMP2878 TaxID=1169474 RepID=A0A0G4HQ89_9ALVE|eukprot:Cvel_30103.t1-p1 / transcript=Cvel_30103.t1 / gene=Cvel_30103 / organism=Chromera_velia_CCMP2878 / gene_product=hypothetical protein / transcript_product=hypothetical protein / location=Cvel_scaffold4244:2844-3557(+) / protein_length=238 / sequence_SO=supercontig / SO=protein_coding / is_pseudo=false
MPVDLAKLKTLDIRLICDPFDPKKHDADTWWTLFKAAKYTHGNLNIEELKVLVQRHGVGDLFTDWLKEKGNFCVNEAALEASFLQKFRPIPQEQTQAVYTLGSYRLSPGGDFDQYLDYFLAEYRKASPGHEIKARILPFIGTFYKDLNSRLISEPPINDWARLITRVRFLHKQISKEKGLAKLAAMQAPKGKQGGPQTPNFQTQPDYSRTAVDQLRAEIAALRQQLQNSNRGSYRSPQ